MKRIHGAYLDAHDTANAERQYQRVRAILLGPTHKVWRTVEEVQSAIQERFEIWDREVSVDRQRRYVDQREADWKIARRRRVKDGKTTRRWEFRAERVTHTMTQRRFW